MMKRTLGSIAALGVVALAACFGDADKLFTNLIEQRMLELGVMEETVTLGRGRQKVELVVPQDVVAVRTQVRVSLVEGTPRRGRHPVTGLGVLVEPANTTFVSPVRVRQLVPPPPEGRRYRTVVVPDGSATFVARGPARLRAAANPELGGYEQWEGDSTGSGLWGLALEEPGDDVGPSDAGVGEVDAAAPAVACAPVTAMGCGPLQSCVLSCLSSGEMAASCVAAGAKEPGEVCNGAGECAPGSVCFKTACGVSVCRLYCSSDQHCGSSRCFVQLGCGDTADNASRLCAQPCDPRGTAQAGCPQGLRCLVFPGEVANCDCPTPARAGGDGAACKDTGGCNAGFICVNTGTPVCRPICRLDEPGTCEAGRSCQRLSNPDHATYGACAP